MVRKWPSCIILAEVFGGVARWTHGTCAVVSKFFPSLKLSLMTGFDISVVDDVNILFSIKKYASPYKR